MNLKTFLTMCLLLFFVTACPRGKGGDDGTSQGPVVEQPAPNPTPAPGDVVEPDPTTQPPVPTPAPVPPTSEVPPDSADTLKFNVKMIGTGTYDTAARKAKYLGVLPRCGRIISSKKFQDLMLAHKFTSTNRSASYVYANLLDANESLQPAKDNEIDMGVKFYYAGTRVIGFTNGSITYINVNVKFFDTYTEVQVCSNLMHEYMHKLGYDHASATDYNSVPYYTGTAVKEAAKTVK